MRATWRIAVASPTEVPPNFITNRDMRETIIRAQSAQHKLLRFTQFKRLLAAWVSSAPMRQDAYKTYLFLSGASSLFLSFIFTASGVYQVTVVGLTPLQLVLVGTLLEIVAFTFEIPTGVVADVYSRRLSVVLSFLLIGAGFLLEGGVPTFGTVLLAQVLWGIGATFESGALDAWVADELGEARAAGAFLRASQVDSVTTVLGIGAGAAVGGLAGAAAPVWIGGLGMMTVGLILAFVMPEHGFKARPREERDSWQSMLRTVREGVRIVRARPVLGGLIGAGFVHGAFSEGFDRLWTPLALSVAMPSLAFAPPIVWLGGLRIITTLLQLPIAELVSRRVKMSADASVSRALMIATGLIMLGLVGLAVAPDFWLVGLAYIVASSARRATGPILQAWKNRQIRGEDSQSRATVLSMYGQVDAVGQIAGGPAVGAIGNLSLRLAMLASAAILSPALLLYRRAGRGEIGAVPATEA
jgi:DHA3 family tetracycline resistance protein-like MFS transporter